MMMAMMRQSFGLKMTMKLLCTYRITKSGIKQTIGF